MPDKEEEKEYLDVRKGRRVCLQEALLVRV